MSPNDENPGFPNDEDSGFGLFPNDGKLGLSLSLKDDEIEPYPYFGVLLDSFALLFARPDGAGCKALLSDGTGSSFNGVSFRAPLLPATSSSPACSVDLLARLDGEEVSTAGLAVDRNEIDSLLKVDLGPTLI